MDRRFGNIPWVAISKTLIDGQWVVTGWGWNVSEQFEKHDFSMSVTSREQGDGGWVGEVRGPDLWDGGRFTFHSMWGVSPSTVMGELEKWLTHTVESGHMESFASRCRVTDDAVRSQADAITRNLRVPEGS